MIKYFYTITLGFFTLSSFAQQPTVGLISYDSTAFEGYALLAPFSSTKTYLLNNCGHVVNTWNSDYTPGAITYLKPDGNLLRTAHVKNSIFDVAGGNGGRIEEYNWDGVLLWYMDLSTDSFSQHHDIELLPNGNILVLIWKTVSRSEALASGKNPNIMAQNTWQECIWEIKPNPIHGGTIVWSWQSMDHLVQDFDNKAKNYGKIAKHPELLNFNSPLISNEKDWLHFNSIDYNEDLDQIMVSCYAFSEIYILDHSTTTNQSAGHIGGSNNKGGDLLYRYGNPLAYGRGSSLNQVSFKQHDAQWIPSGYENAGKVVFFNNGGARLYSSIDMFTPTLNMNGTYKIDDSTTFEPGNADWSYTAQKKETFFSLNMAGVQPLPNGNFFITESTKGHLFEIDTTNTVVWSYINPVSGTGSTKQGDVAKGNVVFRGYKYSADYSAFENINITEGSRLELEPWPIFCDDTTHSNEDTIGTNSVIWHEIGGFEIYPNPTQTKVYVKNSLDLKSMKVFDLTGNLVHSFDILGSQNAELDFSLLTSGLYTVALISTSGIITYRRILKY